MNITYILSKPAAFLIIAIVQIFVSRAVQSDTLVATGSEIKRVTANGTTTTFISSATKGMYYDAVAQKIYFTAGNTINKADRDGTNVTAVVADVGVAIADVAIDHANSRILWTEPDNARIQSANLDGTNTTTLVNGISFPGGIVVDATNGFLYVTEFQGIVRMLLDGSDPTVVIDSSGDYIPYFSIYGEKIYWSNYTANQVLRANLNGSSVEVLASGSDATHIEGVSYDSTLNKVVYVGSPTGGSKLRTMSENGSNNTLLADFNGYDVIADYSTNIVVPTRPAQTRIYFGVRNASSGASRIFWSDLNKQITAVATSSQVSNINALAYSAVQQKLFWADSTSDSQSVIKRSDPDGINIETFATVTGQVNAMVVDDARGKLYLSNRGASKIQSLALTDASYQETIADVGSDNKLVAGLSLYGSSKLIYIIDVPDIYSGYYSHDWYTVETTGAFTKEKIADYGNIFTGFSVYAENRLALITPYFVFRALLPYTSVTEVEFIQSAGSGPSGFQVVGVQHLDPAKFETPYALYYGYRNSIQVAIPHEGDFFRSKFLTLDTNEELKAVTEVTLAPEYSTPIPAPTPNSSGNYEVRGVINVDNAAGESQSPAGIPVNLTTQAGPDSKKRASILADSLNGQAPSRTTLTNSSGEFVFSNIPAGDYLITVGRSDLNFSTDSIAFSAGETLFPIYAEKRDFSEESCTSKDKSSTVSKANDKAKKITDYALKIAASAYAKSKSQQQLASQSSLLSQYHNSLIELSRAIPTIQLNCSGQTTCTNTSFKNEKSSYKKALGQLSKQAQKLIKLALKGKNSSKNIDRLKDLKTAADKALDAFLIKTYQCPVREVPGRETLVSQ